MFSETTNEWQFIPMFGIDPTSFPKLLSVDDMLYVLATRPEHDICTSIRDQKKVECYDPSRNEWSLKTYLPTKLGHSPRYCSTRVFKGFLNIEEEKVVIFHSRDPSSLSLQKNTEKASPKERRQHKCFIL